MYINKRVTDIYIKYIHFAVVLVLCETVNFEITSGHRFFGNCLRPYLLSP